MPISDLTDDYLKACVDVACSMVNSTSESLEDDDDETTTARNPVRIQTQLDGERCVSPGDTTAQGEDCNAVFGLYLDRVYPTPQEALRDVAGLLNVISDELHRRVKTRADAMEGNA